MKGEGISGRKGKKLVAIKSAEKNRQGVAMHKERS